MFNCRRRVCAGCAASLFFYFWQTTSICRAEDAEEPEYLDSISVLSTRGEQATAAGVTPIIVIDSAALQRSGASTVDEVLQHLPAFGFQGVNGNQNDGGYGASFVELRNLNFNRTLVLIDGRRVVLSGIQTDEAVDLANIPVALIDRIEVMADGTEPKYGSDAVAGVVNIVLKHDLSGLTLTAGSGISSIGDDASGEVAVGFGKNLDHGNVTAIATFLHRDPIPQRDRPWADDPIDTAVVGPNGQLILTRGSPATLSGQATTAAGTLGPTMPGYNTATESYLRGGLQRVTLNSLGHYDFGAATAFFELSYSDRSSTTQLPPQALGLSGTNKHPDGFVIPADNPFNPYGEDVTLERTVAAVGDLKTRTDNRLGRGVFGLAGNLSTRIPWSLTLNHGESDTTYTERNAVNLTRALLTVDSAADCAPTPGCVPADYFSINGLSPSAADFIRYTDVTRSRYIENALQGSIGFPVEFLDTPGNSTLGVEYRTESGQTLPDPTVLSGDQAGSDSAITAGKYHTREIYADVELPLLQESAWSKSLQFDASARFVNTNLFGHYPVWKGGLSWAPDDVVLFRGSTGIARRPPAITEAFGGATTLALLVTDPCDAASGESANPIVAANCRSLGLAHGFHQASPFVEVANGGNPHLKPEYSKSYTAGIVLSAPTARPVTLSTDYYHVVIRNAIDSLSDSDPNYIPDQCFMSTKLSSPLCSMIVRAPSGPSAGQISRINAPDQNIGAIITDGIDVALKETLPLGSGTLGLDWQNTVMLDYRIAETPGSLYLQEAGLFPGLVGAGSLTRFRSLLSTVYTEGRWSAAWITRYLGAAAVQGQATGSPFSRAPGITYYDLNAQFHPAPLSFTFGIDNVSNRTPPTLLDGVTNTNTNTYDVVGRYFFLRATINF